MEDLTGGTKILSIGVVAKEYKGQSPNKEKIAQKASRDRYRDQLEQDMALRAAAVEKEKATDSVHPFDRPDASTRLRDKHNENVNGETYDGYKVGRQQGLEDEVRSRREKQQRYLNQLEQDVKTKKSIEASEPTVRTVKRRSPSPEVKGEFTIGVQSTSDGEQKKEKAREFYQLNQEDIERRQLLKSQRSTELDSSFAIGGDDEKKKAQKAEANRIYLEKLNKDLGDRSSTRKVNSEAEYVNRTGWSGLNIGGVSTGNTKSSVALRTQKEKQNAYKQALDSQVSPPKGREIQGKRGT